MAGAIKAGHIPGATLEDVVEITEDGAEYRYQ